MSAYITPVSPSVLFPGIKFASSTAGGAIASGLGASKDYVLLDVTPATGDFPAYNTDGDHADYEDVCQLIYAILHGINAKFYATYVQSPAVEADRPPNWKAAASPTIDPVTNAITVNFYNQFVTGVTGQEVVPAT